MVTGPEHTHTPTTGDKAIETWEAEIAEWINRLAENNRIMLGNPHETTHPEFKPVVRGRDLQYRLYMHISCGNTELWSDSDGQGPIDDQGCDACECAPDGGWRQLYVRNDGDGV